ncbi:MAG: hypothetical protein RXN89_05665 [Vulcanisaeta sp.]
MGLRLTGMRRHQRHTISNNHNTDKNPTQRHVKPGTMRKPPRVMLA